MRGLEAFLAKHSGSADLGLRFKGEQVASGIRFVRMLMEGQYDLIIGNPPYQGTSKMADAKYVERYYPLGKADLYAAFLERGLQLLREGGFSALLTMRNWMFIKQFSGLRAKLLENCDLRILGDMDRGAFDEVPDEVVATVMSVFRKGPPDVVDSVAVQPTPLDDNSRDSARTKRKRAALLCQAGRFDFDSKRLRAVADSPLIYWWSPAFLSRYTGAKKLGDVAPVREGMSTSDNTRFVVKAWEPGKVSAVRCCEQRAPDVTQEWSPTIMGAQSQRWFEPLQDVVRWGANGLQMKVLQTEKYGSSSRRIQSQAMYFRPGVAYSAIGTKFAARLHRYRSIFGSTGSSVFPQDPAHVVCVLNRTDSGSIASSLNPTIHFTQRDVGRLPLVDVPQSNEIVNALDRAFTIHESHREPSVEFSQPGPSPWRYAQAWAQRAVDRPEDGPLPPYKPQWDCEPPTDHMSFAIGVALGRFGANGEGILTTPPASALPNGTLYLSTASEKDGLGHRASKSILAVWEHHRTVIDTKRSLKEYLADEFFKSVHRQMYENRPIYFPLSSKSRSFVAYVSIHRWNADTLRALLAEHLEPERQRLEGEKSDLRKTRQTADKKGARDADKRFQQVDRWLEELDEFIKMVKQCAEKGPPPTDSKCQPRERDARYDPDLDDGVMINAAALWPLLEPQWKDPQKWWKELANAEGKKDYDWAHLAARYFPTRVDEKCKKDPSLAVAHGCFWKYHPEKAYQWELRLKHEIGPDFTLDEADSDAARKRFEKAHPDRVKALVAAEQTRREKKPKDEDADSAEELALDESEPENDNGTEASSPPARKRRRA